MFTEKLNSILKHLDFWMFEFIFLSIFCKKYLQIDIYKHQILAMLLTILPFSLKIITIAISFNESDKSSKILYVEYPCLIAIGVIIYFSMKIMRAYIRIQIKWYMDIKYISIYKLLMIYGLIGTIFYTIICIITTFSECPKDNIYDYFCQTEESSENTKYFASFRIYFKEILFEHPLLE